MRFSLYIALRYLFSKKSRNVINIISTISIVLVAFVSMALFITLSVTNGLNNMVVSMFTTFDPELKIEPVNGKVFPFTDSIEVLLDNPDIASYSKVLEEDVLIKYDERQLIGRIKGVDEQYSKVCSIEAAITNKEFKTKQGDADMAVVGQGMAYQLAIGLEFYTPIQIYAPKRGKKVKVSPEDAYNKGYCHPAGLFSIQQDIDSRYMITNLDFAKRLLDYDKEISAVEIKLRDESLIPAIKQKLRAGLGEEYTVKDRYEQHEFLYKVMQSEKWIIFLIISLICIIASFSTIGTLSMIIIDKKHDIGILQSMGATIQTIKKIFLLEGWFVSVFGGVAGLAVGLIIVCLQEHFGLLKVPGSGNFVIEAYPVAIKSLDLIVCFGIVVIIGFVASYFPVRKLDKLSIREE